MVTATSYGNRQPPSYSNDYARNASASIYPEEWRGSGYELVGMWIAELGPNGSQLADLSGKNHPAVLTNMVVKDDWIGSNKGWVVDLDGGDDQLIVANNTDHDFGTGSFSISILYKPGNAVGAKERLTFKFTGDTGFSTNQQGFSGKIRFAILSPGQSKNSITTTAIVNNEWVHLFMVLDRSVQLIRIYFDGIEQPYDSQDDTTDVASINTTQDFAIGAKDSAGEELKAVVSQVRLYKGVVPDAIIKQMTKYPLGIVSKRQRRSEVWNIDAAIAAADLTVWYEASGFSPWYKTLFRETSSTGDSRIS